MAVSRRVPIRTCVACQTAFGKKGLLRVVRDPETGLAEFDPTGKRPGRGAYVCASVECVLLSVKRKAFERSLKASGCNAELSSHLASACAESADPPPPDAVS